MTPAAHMHGPLVPVLRQPFTLNYNELMVLLTGVTLMLANA